MPEQLTAEWDLGKAGGVNDGVNSLHASIPDIRRWMVYVELYMAKARSFGNVLIFTITLVVVLYTSFLRLNIPLSRDIGMSLQNQLQSRPYFEVGNKEPRYFRDVNSVDRFYLWLKAVYLPFLNVYNTPWELQNGTYVPDMVPFTSLLSKGNGFTSSLQMLALGKLELRQHRVSLSDNTCTDNGDYTGGCYGEWTIGTNEKDSFVGVSTSTVYTYDNTETPPYYPPYAYPESLWSANDRVMTDKGFVQSMTVQGTANLTDTIDTLILDEWINPSTRSVQLLVNLYVPNEATYVNLLLQFDFTPAMTCFTTFKHVPLFASILWESLLLWSALSLYLLFRSVLLGKRVWEASLMLLRQWAYERTQQGHVAGYQGNHGLTKFLLYCGFLRLAAFVQASVLKDYVEIVLILLFGVVLGFDSAIYYLVEDLPNYTTLVSTVDGNKYNIDVENVARWQTMSVLFFAFASSLQWVYVIGTFSGIFMVIGPFFVNIRFMFSTAVHGTFEVLKLAISVGLAVVAFGVAFAIAFGDTAGFYSRFGASALNMFAELNRTHITSNFLNLLISPKARLLTAVAQTLLGVILTFAYKATLVNFFSTVMIIVMISRKDSEKNNNFILRHLDWDDVIFMTHEPGLGQEKSRGFCRYLWNDVILYSLGYMVGFPDFGRMTSALNMLSNNHRFLLDALKRVEEQAGQEIAGLRDGHGVPLITRIDFECWFQSTNLLHTQTSEERDAYALLWTSLQNFSRQIKELQGFNSSADGAKHSPLNFYQAVYQSVEKLQRRLLAETELSRQFQSFVSFEMGTIAKALAFQGSKYDLTNHPVPSSGVEFDPGAILNKQLHNSTWDWHPLRVPPHIVAEFCRDVTFTLEPPRQREHLVIEIYGLQIAASYARLSEMAVLSCQVELFTWKEASPIQCFDLHQMCMNCDDLETSFLNPAELKRLAVALGRTEHLQAEADRIPIPELNSYADVIEIMFPPESPCRCDECTGQCTFSYWLPARGHGQRYELSACGNQRDILERCWALLRTTDSLFVDVTSAKSLRHGLSNKLLEFGIPEPLSTASDSEYVHAVVDAMSQIPEIATQIQLENFEILTSYQVATAAIAAQHPGLNPPPRLWQLRPALCTRSTGSCTDAGIHARGPLRTLDSVVKGSEYASGTFSSFGASTLLDVRWSRDHQFEFGVDRRSQVEVVVVKVHTGTDYPCYLGQATVETHVLPYNDPGTMHLPLVTVHESLNVVGDRHEVASSAHAHVAQTRLGQDDFVEATLEMSLVRSLRSPLACSNGVHGSAV